MVALEQAVAQAGRSEGQSGFLLIEPDHYARILPEIGLDSADALIASLAAHLASVLDDSVVAARFGEHSFALLMDGNYARSHALAELVRDAFAQHVFSVGERSATVTVSIGGVQIGEKIASIGQVLNRGTGRCAPRPSSVAMRSASSTRPPPIAPRKNASSAGWNSCARR